MSTLPLPLPSTVSTLGAANFVGDNLTLDFRLSSGFRNRWGPFLINGALYAFMEVEFVDDSLAGSFFDDWTGALQGFNITSTMVPNTLKIGRAHV